jgi:hypothetical protein
MARFERALLAFNRALLALYHEVCRGKCLVGCPFICDYQIAHCVSFYQSARMDHVSRPVSRRADANLFHVHYNTLMSRNLIVYFIE